MHHYSEILNRQFQLEGDAAKPFTCWEGSGTDWTEPEPTNVDGEG